MSKYKSASVSVILPCVGRGAWANLPHSKELVMIDENTSVIDNSFNHILASHENIRVIVVVSPNKMDLVQYVLARYNNKIDLNIVFLEKETENIADAVKAVKPLLNDKNIVLHPNKIIAHDDKKLSFIDDVLESLEQQSFTFVVKDESSVSRIKTNGAMVIENGKVVGYEYRPQKNVSKYNAIGAAFAFKTSVFDAVLALLAAKNLQKDSGLLKTQPVTVSEATDISTWTHLNGYLLKQYLTRSGIDSQFLKLD